MSSRRSFILTPLNALVAIALLYFAITFFAFPKRDASSEVFMAESPGISAKINLQPQKINPSQVVILGMHHSATSLCSRLIIMMGLYGGQRDEFIFHIDPAVAKYKFWERRDVVNLNQRLFDMSIKLTASGSQKGVPKWSGYKYDSQAVKDTQFAKTRFPVLASDIIGKLNQHRPWVTKEPRMNLLMDLWRPHLDSEFVCVLVYRHPIEIGRRMSRYGLEQNDWIELWRNYTVSALKGCEGQPKVIALQSKLGKEPLEFTKHIYRSLTELGVDRLSPLDEQEVMDFLAVKPSEEEGRHQLLKYEEILKQDEDKLALLPTDLDRCLVLLFEKEVPFEYSDIGRLCRDLGIALPDD